MKGGATYTQNKGQSIIESYVQKLRKQLEEKNSLSFWVISGYSISKRMLGLTFNDIHKLIKGDKKYWGEGFSTSDHKAT